uniref:Protein quiver n=1 Tax=Bactrocera latifrons TaxID=174628 RepID=A0A0K8VVG5_BACLA
MRTAEALVTLAVFGLCCLTFANSLKCYSCTSTKECKKPSKLECNSNAANKTRDYLNLLYTGVPGTNFTSQSFVCVRDWLKTSSNEFTYKGCAYSNYQSCSYPVNPYYSQHHERKCAQCNRDACNPAARANGSLLTVITTIVATVAVKILWRPRSF